jgi:GR25 family glycosyltransferase involved in LPS biosynthesis
MLKNGVFINLDRSADRRALMESQLNWLGMDWVKRFAAIDGRTLTLPPACRITAGELACFRSHLEVIESAPPDSFTFVFEDDVDLARDLPLILHDDQLAMLANHDIVFLECQPNWHSTTLSKLWASLSRQMLPGDERRVRGVELHDGASMYCWAAAAYVVTPKGHRVLSRLFRDCLDLGPPGPVDILLAHAMQDGRISGAVLVPFLANARLDSHVMTTVPGRTLAAQRLALASAVRRMFFAGPLTGLHEFAAPLLERPEGVTPEMELLGDLMARIFTHSLRDGDFIIG